MTWTVIVWFQGEWKPYYFPTMTKATEFQNDMAMFGYIAVRYASRAW